MAITLDGSDNKIAIGANATGSSAVRLYEDTDNGTNYVDIIAPASITSNRTLTLPDATGTLLTNSGTEAGAFSTLSVNSNNISAENSLGFRNRIINGDMRIDQRNAGASATTYDVYSLDRWYINNNTGASRFSWQQNAGSVTPPTGFTKYLGVTSSGAYSVTATNVIAVRQAIEGFNVSDLGWGTANAKTVTLSFWVRSSLTGTFGGAILNSGATRSYPFSYTISSANTWTSISVTIAGDTTGTWLTNNGIGLDIYWNLGTGSTYSGTAGSWSGSSFYSATGATSVVGTNGATFYITGVQLEVGSVATPFERRDYGRELIMCQRYFETSYDSGTAVPTNTNVGALWFCPTGSKLIYSYPFKVTKRASPTTVFYSPADSATGNYRNDTGATNVTVANGGISGTNFLYMYKFSGATDQTECNVHFSVNAEL